MKSFNNVFLSREAYIMLHIYAAYKSTTLLFKTAPSIIQHQITMSILVFVGARHYFCDQEPTRTQYAYLPYLCTHFFNLSASVVKPHDSTT